MNKEEKANSGLTVSSNARPVGKHVNNGVQKTASLIYDGILDPQTCKEEPASESEQDLVFVRLPLNRKLPESFSLRNLHRCVFLSQTVSVLKYLIPADRN